MPGQCRHNGMFGMFFVLGWWGVFVSIGFLGQCRYGGYFVLGWRDVVQEPSYERNSRLHVSNHCNQRMYYVNSVR